jgi:hypothetical protein
VKYNGMPDGYPITDDGWMLSAGDVNDSVVLHRHFLTDANVVHVATKDYAVPH